MRPFKAVIRELKKADVGGLSFAWMKCADLLRNPTAFVEAWLPCSAE
jgi:hypothetical protein